MIQHAESPVLETERLRLRPWRRDDFEPLASFYASAISEFVGGPLSPADTWRRMAMFIGHWSLRGFGNWVIEEKATQRAIGYAGLWEPHGWPESEIMWALYEGSRGKGYATEAARRARVYAYQVLGWPTAVSYIHPDNAASRGVARRLGAKPDGKTRLGAYVLDVWRHPGPAEITGEAIQ